MPNFPYRSFCWSLGTTSFRTKKFNRTIEQQLELLHEFWNMPENANAHWRSNPEVQAAYYDFMKEKCFVDGDAPNKSKDAREKTSGLVDIGLIDDDHKLTEIGQALLQISQSGDFSTNNVLLIQRDSFIYLKQLLKTTNIVNGETVRPMIVLIYLLSELGSLSYDEFKYLLPLCVSYSKTEYIVGEIRKLRSGFITLDSIIIDCLMAASSYSSALNYFLPKEVTEDVLCDIGMNRKSRAYDKSYLPLYKALRSVFVDKNMNAIPSILEATKDINIGKLWRAYFFDTNSRTAIIKEPAAHLKQTILADVRSEEEFKTAFFKVLHLLKAKATLNDYFDLNCRYFKTTDIVLFGDETVTLDIVPKHFFNSIINQLYETAYSPCDLLQKDCSMEAISASLVFDESSVVAGINAELGTTITSLEQAKAVIEDERYRRFNSLISARFSDDQIIILLDLFSSRSDAEISARITDNADIPTMFEYVLGVLWYKASEFRGKILDYMKLSLDADLLPKTHAAGGNADIVYEYPETETYPAHSLLLEATLADSTNQRRMEMEPVSRHLGQHLIKYGNPNSYCIFATNDLNINVISDFRARKNTPYYDVSDYTKYVEGMKIITLDINDLKSIVQHHRTYREMYPVFEEAFNSTLPPHIWHTQLIRQVL